MRESRIAAVAIILPCGRAHFSECLVSLNPTGLNLRLYLDDGLFFLFLSFFSSSPRLSSKLRHKPVPLTSSVCHLGGADQAERTSSSSTCSVRGRGI
jgi:hypothetical protein